MALGRGLVRATENFPSFYHCTNALYTFSFTYHLCYTFLAIDRVVKYDNPYLFLSLSFSLSLSLPLSFTNVVHGLPLPLALPSHSTLQ